MKADFKYVLYVRNILAACLVLFVLWTLLNGCKKSSDMSATMPAAPGTNEVWMQNIAFVPSSITVNNNTTVTWTNKDDMAHTVTSDNIPMELNSGNVAPGVTYSHKFTVVGSYPYHCTIHAGMTGMVIVH